MPDLSCLPKSSRITLKRQFEHIFSWGNRIEGNSIRIQFCSPYSGHPKVAFVAPRRIGNAVKRNLAKRRLREIYRLAQGGAMTPSDMVIIAKAPLITAPFISAQDQFVELIARLKKKNRPNDQISRHHAN